MSRFRTIGLLALLLAGWGALPLLAAPSAEDRKKEEEERRAHEDAVKRVIDVFDVEYRSKDETVRVAAVDKLSEMQDRKILDRLSRVIQGRDTDAVKLQAVRMVGRYAGDKNAVRILNVALNANKKRSPELAGAAVEAMGDLDDHTAVPMITGLFREKDTVIAKAAIVAAAKIRDKSFVDPLLKLLRELEEELPAVGGGSVIANPIQDAMAKRKAELLDPVQRSLADITQQAFTTHKEWSDWWRKHKSTFKTDPDAKR